MNVRRLLSCVCLSVLCLTTASPALALANRVFVSQRSGNDATSCDNILTPCRTFAGAVVQLNPGGEAIVLDSGGYGPVTITQAVTIEAPPGVLAFIHPPSGDAITVNAGATDRVILRGLTLNGGTSNGIAVNGVGSLFVEHCVITGFTGDGISFAAAGGTLFMNNDDVRGSGAGVVVTSAGASARAVIRDSTFTNNTNGVRAAVGAIVSVTDCAASGNSSNGFLAEATTATNVNMTLERVQAVANGTGVAAETIGGMATGIAVLLMADSVVTQNQTGVTWFGNTSAVYGTSPGTSLIAGNVTDGNPLPISNLSLR